MEVYTPAEILTFAHFRIQCKPLSYAVLPALLLFLARLQPSRTDEPTIFTHLTVICAIKMRSLLLVATQTAQSTAAHCRPKFASNRHVIEMNWIAVRTAERDRLPIIEWFGSAAPKSVQTQLCTHLMCSSIGQTFVRFVVRYECVCVCVRI